MRTWIVVALAAMLAACGCSRREPVPERSGQRPVAPRLATELAGKAAGVMDGDTMVLSAGGAERKVRLARIDAPEKSQPFGPEAKACLEGMVTGRSVRVSWNREDMYGRVIGEVVVRGRSVNEAMVEKGMAWQYAEYDKSADLKALESKARTNRLGLWSQAEPEAPWDYRRGKRRMEP